jgi:hypothetical protein
MILYARLSAGFFWSKGCRMIDNAKLALHSGRQLVQRDRYMAPHEVHDQAMQLGYHHGVQDHELERFCLLFCNSYAFNNPALFPVHPRSRMSRGLTIVAAGNGLYRIQRPDGSFIGRIGLTMAKAALRAMVAQPKSRSFPPERDAQQMRSALGRHDSRPGASISKRLKK